MAKAKKSTSGGRKSANIKPMKRAPKPSAKRNTAIPKLATRRSASNGARAATPRELNLPRVSGEITQDMIAQRAYEIYLSGSGGSEFDNWCRAERELRGL